MTQAEFNASQQQSREVYLSTMRSANRELARLYIRSANEVSEKIKTLELKIRGDSLTAVSLRKLETTLRMTGARIAGETENLTIDIINDSISETNKSHVQYLKDAIKISGIDKIEFSVIENMYSNLNETMIDLTYSRVWSSGYTFSDSVWGFPGTPEQPYLPGLGGYWTKNIKDLVTMGLMQGRDVLQIAKDLSVYAVKGKKGLMKRYGELVRVTASFSKRVPANIDWRALRLARSELYISLQDSSKIQGRMNPSIKEYKWNLTGGRGDWGCICPDLAADSPYQELDIPDYPHPNCLCYIIHVIRGRDEFVNDLIDWGKGIGVPYLDQWFTSIYLPFIA